MERPITLIENQKWIYHLSSMGNLEGILTHGLASRAALRNAGGQFEDIADPEILNGRAVYGLDQHVPFHFFSKNPFDGNVQTNRRTEDFFYVCVSREHAKLRSYKILPRHPLAKESPTLYDYAEGFREIDWEKMNTREYRDQEIKLICMAECLSLNPVPTKDFAKLVFCNKENEALAQEISRKIGISIDTWINPNFFLKRS